MRNSVVKQLKVDTYFRQTKVYKDSFAELGVVQEVTVKGLSKRVTQWADT
jgi:hypothetical protein